MAEDRRLALGGALALHLGVLAAGLVALRGVKPPPPLGQAVPVTVVTAEAANVRPAEAAPVETPASSPEPGPTPAPAATASTPAPAPAVEAPTPPRSKPVKHPLVKLAPTPPIPAPEPVGATPKPALKPRPTSNPKPKPADVDPSALTADLPTAKPRREALDLASLSTSLGSSRSHADRGALDLTSLAASLPSRRGAGAPGPAHAETARTARKAVGAATALSGDEVGALRAKLNRLWNPNCGVEGAGAVIVKVRMRLGAGGALTGAPEVLGSSGDASADVVRAAAVRAASAVARGAPYTEISPDHLRTLNDFVFRFDARQACGG